MNQINPISDTFDLIYDPVVSCEWIPDREVRLSEYNQMITSYLRKSPSWFVEKCIKEYTDAKPVRIKKSSD